MNNGFQDLNGIEFFKFFVFWGVSLFPSFLMTSCISPSIRRLEGEAPLPLRAPASSAMAEQDPIAEKENFESGPLSLLTKVVKDNSQVQRPRGR